VASRAACTSAHNRKVRNEQEERIVVDGNESGACNGGVRALALESERSERERSKNKFDRAGGHVGEEWSDWLAVACWLDHGWNLPGIPWVKGVYRFRVQPNNPGMGGEVIYLGRGSSHSGKDSTSICSRVGSFITAAMGFWTYHSGGETFFTRSALGGNKEPVHHLSVRDLEVSWAADEDPICREAEELVALQRPPIFNQRPTRSCRREECMRAKRLWEVCKVW
jgi:hypothetical protein